MAFLTDWISATWQMVVESAPWLVAGFGAAGLISLILPRARIVHHLGQRGWRGVLKASLLGVPLPLCSCSVIPVASSIRQRGASRGATAGFLISTPETGVDSIGLSYALLGPFFAVARPVVAFITAFTAGSLIDRFCPDEPAASHKEPQGAHECCHAETSRHEAPLRAEKRWPSKVMVGLKYGMVDMFADLGHWLLIGFLLAGLVSALLPDDILEGSIGRGPITLLIMAGIGLPLYVCATSSTPVVAALMAKGLSPGAALVFLLVGPATNAATMLIVGRDLGRRSLVIYLATIAVLAIGCGLVTDQILGSVTAIEGAVCVRHHESAGILAIAAAIALTLLTLNGVRIRVSRHLRKRRADKEQGGKAHFVELNTATLSGPGEP